MQLRMTNQREMILQELKKSKEHLTADELYDRVRKRMPRISLATVYRNLEILSEAGMIGKLEVSGRQKRFDWNAEEHDHIFCVKCHRVDNLELNREDLDILSNKNLAATVSVATGWNFPDCARSARKSKTEKRRVEDGRISNICTTDIVRGAEESTESLSRE